MSEIAYMVTECRECHRRLRLPAGQPVCGICRWYDSWMPGAAGRVVPGIVVSGYQESR